MQKYILSIIISFLFSFQLNGQELWPGDINNDGIVSNIDVLYAGLAWGTTGPPRTNADITWMAQDITTPWAETFPNGLNYAYADTNGDGIINQFDIINAIKDNYGLTHGTVTPFVFSDGIAGVDPALKLENTTGGVSLGGTLDIDLNLGDLNIPANDFYGIAFSIEYDDSIIDEIDFNEDAGSWIVSTGDDIHELTLKNTVTGEYDVAVTRKDQISVSGFGKIGSLGIVIEDIVVGLVSDTTVYLGVNDLVIITHEMNEIPVVSDSIAITIQNTTPIKDINESNSHVSIQPNPTSNFFVVQSGVTMIKAIGLYNLLGEQISLTQGIEENHYTYLTTQLPSGIYIVMIQTNLGIESKKIIIE